MQAPRAFKEKIPRPDSLPALVAEEADEKILKVNSNGPAPLSMIQLADFKRDKHILTAPCDSQKGYIPAG